MDGRQSFLLNIKTTLRGGGNVTHILNVKVSRPERGNAMRQAIFQAIANVPVVQQWRTSATTTSAYYHANVPLFTDLVVKRHTVLLLRSILHDLDARFGGVFAAGMSGRAFLVSKPLTREVALADDDDGDEDEEIDEAAETGESGL
ncbi:hypothetical protein HDU87_008641 [Geranomyces variabilis]|uniref:Uncharacterized protein n=1 Tax=Geranomyces variabilis TaxID=109894 RepID=A0AAD5XJR2_9FUNG|nr:hypothetical protein HDU87_008641 [Geranomyces variabilis]